MTDKQVLENRQPWTTRWLEQKTGWNLGQAHPYLVDLLERAGLEGGLAPAGRIYVPGCGHGHEAAALAQLGYQTVAVDFVEQAIQEAKLLYGQQVGITFAVSDVLALAPGEEESFDGIIDRAMLCALNHANRTMYVKACEQRLKPGGLFAGLLFAEVNISRDAGPPFAISEQELWNLWSEAFDLVHLERRTSVNTQPSAIQSEWLTIWRKKEADASKSTGGL